MHRLFAICALVALCACAHAQRPLTRVLFDFEDGIEGWWGNVYNGAGECTPTATGEAKFGTGAVHCEVVGVEGGSNVVCPWFAPDVEWRQWQWGIISVWVKGDGTPYSAKLSITTGLEDDETHLGYSFNLPLDSTQWRQVRAPVRAFWNREKVPMDTQRIGRVMFGSSGTHSFDIDQIVLEAPQRPVPLEARGLVLGIDLQPDMLQFEDGRCALMLDPSPLAEGGAVLSGDLSMGDNAQKFMVEIKPGPPAGEALIEFPAPADTGPAKLALTATRGGEELSSAQYGLSMVATEQPVDPTPLQLVPAPKEYTALRSKLPLTEAMPVTVKAGAVDPAPALNLLRDSMKPWGVTLGEPKMALADGLSEIVVGGAEPLPEQFATRVASLPAEGYMLEVTSEGARIAAKDTRGLVNGACTLLQAVGSHWATTGELAAPGMRVFDWPNLPIRTLSLSLPTSRWGHPNDPPVDPEFFKDYLRRTVVDLKLNMVVILVDQGVQFETHPEVSGPAAWPKQTVREIVEMLRSYGVEPVPGENSLGHANWLCIPHKELAEDG
ncbi:MAG TPA: glycoside hydrolase family 20 zincin-like fold domain-containing protein, partial [Armatimonadota bacterium]|nr:glycoside hydrolase family 20 zincin-like fold domain-containing protein [Armatimonadota bacterium]